MAKDKQLPLVAICGRPNVGKSTLFNRIVGKQRAIIHGEEGITRDRTYAQATYDDWAFRVVDTGGIVENPDDSIAKKMQQQVQLALEDAKLIIFVVDGQEEITRVDEQIRDQLIKTSKPVILAVNKLDNFDMDMNRFDFFSLGLGEPYAISSGHDRGMEPFMEAVTKHLPKGAEDSAIEVEEDVTRVAIVGKPNVGKSSFVNAILQEERTIVTDVPGTTRDAVDIDFQWKDNRYLLIDTAGLRKKARIGHDVERFSVSRSLRAINRADVAVVMIDAIEGISEQDKRIFNYINEHGTATVLAWSKWDLVQDKEAAFKRLSDAIDLKMPFLKYVPYITVSNVTRQRIFKIFEVVDSVAHEANRRIPTAELNKFAENLMANNAPPTRKGRAAKIYYLTQSSIKPTTFVLFANDKRLVHWSYTRHIENKLRETYGFGGVPISLQVRDKKEGERR
jgi:GTP-binding protein